VSDRDGRVGGARATAGIAPDAVRGAATDLSGRALAYLASPAARRTRRALATVVILGAPALFRMPVLRRRRVVRLLEMAGGVALTVRLAERLRDWEPAAPARERAR
jgi:hypothetical protein